MAAIAETLCPSSPLPPSPAGEGYRERAFHCVPWFCNGDIHHRLAGNNLHISIPHIPNSAIIARIRHQLNQLLT
ncbi:hypothetical protein PJF56_05860 [Roseofilum sp. BLCC_M91]|uniref:Uncharacterized protein n=1 Tax=Roseofilum halophilum BLCC-M91 TaxID=3022259 RepID=A0ABT7BGR9_9CYAN|nr:hypothetical protein [Roseofilum halophilum]MDJ1178382.1 hypothetical protein [Roseofilum halophilum BLCC-M91]